MGVYDEAGAGEYDDPITYDEENRLEAERDFFLDLSQRYGGPVLDLACGTGRLTIPIAQAGFQCVGVDNAPAMLNHARKKSTHLPITYVLADCRRLNWGGKFGFALLTGYAFQAFMTDDDQARLLRVVASHLCAGGGFAFETRNPSSLRHASNEGRQWERSYRRADGSWVDSFCLTRYDPAADLLHVTQHREMRSSGQLRVTRFALRYSDDSHCRRMLSRAGFRIVESYGDFEGTPFTPQADTMVYICERLTKR